MSHLTLEQRETLQKCGKREKIMGMFTVALIWFASVYVAGHVLAWIIKS